jgi:RNA polymerase sigma-70 factor, ECF subfamily
MVETSPSLLEQLRARPEPEAWRVLVDLYTPLLYGWLRRYGLQGSDADDVVQETLGAVVRELPGFHYDASRGSFRGWLRTILVHRLRVFWRARQARPLATGDSEMAAMLDQLADPHSDLSRLWDVEHDRHLAHRLLARIEPDFEPAMWQAFRRTVLDGLRASTVAAELGVSVNAVFLAKSRVLRRLRQEMRGFSDGA